MPKSTRASRYFDQVVISENMCEAAGPGYGHKCVKDRHPRTENHQCLCGTTWDEPPPE